MNATADATTVHDPAVPGLGLLLDDDALRGWLAARGERLLRRDYVRYKAGTSCVAALELDSGRAFALATSVAARPKLDKLRSHARSAGGSAHDDDLHVALAPMRADRDLPALADLAHAVARLVPDATDPRTLVHKPQRRWVGVVAATPVLVRAYRRNEVSDALRRLHHAQRVGTAVRVPRVLGRSQRHALLGVEYLEGTTLDAAPTGPASGADVRAAGRALAAVHGCPATGMPTTVVANPAATVRLVQTLLPQLQDALAGLLTTLGSRPPPATETTACHGDFSLDQVVAGPDGRIGFIDWDRGGAGHPAADLGSLVASGVPRDTLDAFLDGYDQVRQLPSHLDWYVTQARVRRLAEPFRLASPHWAAEVRDNVGRLEAPWR